MTVINNSGFIIILEKGTLQHTIALQTMISSGCDPKYPDYEIFTGDVILYALYLDMCKANSKAINKEFRDRLKL